MTRGVAFLFAFLLLLPSVALANGRIVFERGENLVSTSQVGVFEETITRGSDPAYAPDGRRLAFVRDGDIYSINDDGTRQTPLTAGSERDDDPAYSPDGQTIAFSRDGAIWIMTSDGSGARRVPIDDRLVIAEGKPSFYPGGDRIAYERFAVPPGGSGPNESTELTIYAVDVDGSNLERITGARSNPDILGDRILYNGSCGDSEGVCIRDDEGTTERVRVGGAAPNFSPDGTRIAFALYSGLYTARVDGSDVRRIAQTGVFALSESDWGVQSGPTCSDLEATVVGTAGSDVLKGGGVVVGLGGDDRIRASAGPDLACGGAGDDAIVGFGGQDQLFGGPGADHLLGGRAGDLLVGGSGPDLLAGGPGADLLVGLPGADTLRGAKGDDILDGGAGRDRCNGGSGDNRVRGC